MTMYLDIGIKTSDQIYLKQSGQLLGLSLAAAPGDCQFEIAA